MPLNNILTVLKSNPDKIIYPDSCCYVMLCYVTRRSKICKEKTFLPLEILY